MKQATKMSDVGRFELELERDWILITYDIPRDQDAERKRVIRALKKIGALKHTDSVYYLPGSDKAMEIAKSLPGEAYVWRSSPTSDIQAKELTENYYTQIVEGIEKLENRLEELEDGQGLTVEGQRQKLAYDIEVLEQLEAAASNIGLSVCERLSDVRQRLNRLREQV